MKKNDRIRIYGARFNRFIYRFFTFTGMLALYSIIMGTVADENGMHLYGILILAGLTIGIAVGWFSSRRQRETDRSHQLAAEVTLLFPYATAAEQEHEYAMRRRREMRLEAAFYFFLAVIAVVWLWGMYIAEAQPVSRLIGGLVILPGLLLISLVLLVLSLIPRENGMEMPEVSELDRQLALRAMGKSGAQTDCAEYHTVYDLSVVPEKDKVPTAGEYLLREKKQTRKNYHFLMFGMWFFFILPLILFGFGIIMVLADGPKWFLVYSGFLALISTTLWFYMTHAPGSMGTVSATRRRLKQLKSGKCGAYIDAVLSHRMGVNGAEIVFEQSGKVLYPCNSKAYNVFFPVQRHAAVIITFEDKIQSVMLLPAGEDTVPVTTMTENDVPTENENDIPLSDEALHQAALEAIERMAPLRRREMEAQIEQSFDQIEALCKKDYMDLTSAERGEIHSSAAEDIRKSYVDLTLSSTEASVMEALNVSRSDIMNMKKNPFAASLYRKLLIAVLVEIAGVAITAVIEKSTGASLGYVYLLVSLLTGSLAFSCAENISSMRRFRKLQKAYRDPEYRHKMLDAVIYREIREQVKQRRERQ